MLEIETEFRHGIFFIRLIGVLNKKTVNKDCPFGNNNRKRGIQYYEKKKFPNLWTDRMVHGDHLYLHEVPVHT